jgi:putative membrane protein
MMWWGDGDWSIGSWLVMSLMMLTFWGLLAGLIVALVRGRSQPRDTSGAHHQSSHRPEDVLADRFARGEIDEEEFTRRRSVLHATHDSSHPTGTA